MCAFENVDWIVPSVIYQRNCSQIFVFIASRVGGHVCIAQGPEMAEARNVSVSRNESSWENASLRMHGQVLDVRDGATCWNHKFRKHKRYMSEARYFSGMSVKLRC